MYIHTYMYVGKEIQAQCLQERRSEAAYDGTNHSNQQVRSDSKTMSGFNGNKQQGVDVYTYLYTHVIHTHVTHTHVTHTHVTYEKLLIVGITVEVGNWSADDKACSLLITVLYWRNPCVQLLSNKLMYILLLRRKILLLSL